MPSSVTGRRADATVPPSPDVPTLDILRYAAQRATLAPSVHNTQPWWFVIRDGVDLEIWADVTRQLSVLDRRKRQLTISCGCALFNARVGIVAKGYEAVVERFPDPARPHLVATVRVGKPTTGWQTLATLDEAIDDRRTNRREFLSTEVPPDVVFDLVSAARAEGAVLLPINRPEHARTVARLSREADSLENTDRAYRSEIARWTTDDPHRVDGVQTASIPNVPRPEDGAPTAPLTFDQLPMRAFDANGLGWLPSNGHTGTDQCLLLLGSLDDTPLGWLHAGEALERIWLDITRRGFHTSPMTQLVEVARTYDELRRSLRLSMYPDALLRVGRAAQVERSHRRPYDDVVVEVS